MISLRKKQEGFTIVELLIVIVVIGILALLVFNTFSGVQKKARDTERKTDLQALHGQLEAYHASNAKYPTLADLQDNDAAGDFVQTNLKGLDVEAMKDPKGADNNVAGAAAANVYAYIALPAGCDNAAAATECQSYTLTATLEGGGTFDKKSLN